MYYKIFKSKSPQYLFKLILEKKKPSSYVTRHADNFPRLNTKYNFYKNSFFPLAIIEWSNVDSNLRKAENIGAFKNNILKFIRLKPNSFFNCFNLKGIRVITRLRLELSHVHEHEFVYNFQSCLNPHCSLFICFSFWIIFNFFGFFYTPRHLRFSVPGDCDFLVYCVTLYIKIYINIFPVLHF